MRKLGCRVLVVVVATLGAALVGCTTDSPTAKVGIGAEGGTVVSSDGQLSIRVPPSALTTATPLTIQPASGAPEDGVGQAYKLGPEGATFGRPVVLTFTPPASQKASDLVVATEVDGRWLPLPAAGEANAKTVSGQTLHFSVFGLVSKDLFKRLEDCLKSFGPPPPSPPIPCTKDLDCVATNLLRCYQGQCRLQCKKDEDCNASERCHDGVCVDPCDCQVKAFESCCLSSKSASSLFPPFTAVNNSGQGCGCGNHNIYDMTDCYEKETGFEIFGCTKCERACCKQWNGWPSATAGRCKCSVPSKNADAAKACLAKCASSGQDKTVCEKSRNLGEPGEVPKELLDCLEGKPSPTDGGAGDWRQGSEGGPSDGGAAPFDGGFSCGGETCLPGQYCLGVLGNPAAGYVYGCSSIPFGCEQDITCACISAKQGCKDCKQGGPKTLLCTRN